MNLKKKIGPLPVWAWGLIFGVAGYYIYVRRRTTSSAAASSAATSPTASVLDPNAVDPATGLTYGQELSNGFPGPTGSTAAGGTTTPTVPGDTSAGSSSPGISNPAPDPATQLANTDATIQGFAQVQQDVGTLAQQLGFSAPGATTAAAQWGAAYQKWLDSAVAQHAATPPRSPPSVHTLVARAVGKPPGFKGPGTYVGQPGAKVPFNPITAGLQAIGHGPKYNGTGRYEPVIWGPHTRKAGHQLPHHSLSY